MSNFVSKPEHYARNTKQAANLAAGAAILTNRARDQEPAVVLHSGNRVHNVLPVAEALRLANEVADAFQKATQ